MEFEKFKAYCLSKEGVEETYPFGDTAVWFEINGKAFCWTFVEMYTVDGALKPAFTFVNCKCDPDQALEWRLKFSAVRSGWHRTGKHWNAVFMDGTLSDEDFKMMIDHAYELVLKSLSPKV